MEFKDGHAETGKSAKNLLRLITESVAEFIFWILEHEYALSLMSFKLIF